VLDPRRAHHPLALSAHKHAGHIEPVVALQLQAAHEPLRHVYADRHGVRDTTGDIEAAKFERASAEWLRRDEADEPDRRSRREAELP
jgi:hypothetical protein